MSERVNEQGGESHPNDYYLLLALSPRVGGADILHGPTGSEHNRREERAIIFQSLQ